MEDGGKRLGNKNERYNIKGIKIGDMRKKLTASKICHFIAFFNERSINESRVVSF